MDRVDNPAVACAALAAALLFAACSRREPPRDENAARMAFRAGFDRGFMPACVDGAEAKMRTVGRDVDRAYAQAACDCIYPRLLDWGVARPEAWKGADALTIQHRAREVQTAYLTSEQGKADLQVCLSSAAAAVAFDGYPAAKLLR